MALAHSSLSGLADSPAFRQTYQAIRRHSAQLFSLVENVLLERPLPRRNPCIFYLGHLPVFSYMTLAKVCDMPPLSADVCALFGRGIDPSNDEAALALQPPAWPSIDGLTVLLRKLDQEIEAMLDRISARTLTSRNESEVEAAHTILEHEYMHQETLLYLITALKDEQKNLTGRRSEIESPGPQQRSSRIITIPGGLVTLGAQREDLAFGWDNEFSAEVVEVGDFAVDSLPITNQLYLRDVEDGVAPPWNWICEQNRWYLKTPLAVRPLPLHWPVYVSAAEAQAYARRHGARLMTEPEFHRAAYGTPTGPERRFPWGDAAPEARHGNFHFRRYCAENVGLSPAGASAWQVEELVGNGWEITSTPFYPFQGFTPMASYPQYSADFFDGNHLVVKGASPVTAMPLLRRSLRNWFFADYPYAFTKFRLVYDSTASAKGNRRYL